MDIDEAMGELKLKDVDGKSRLGPPYKLREEM